MQGVGGKRAGDARRRKEVERGGGVQLHLPHVEFGERHRIPHHGIRGEGREIGVGHRHQVLRRKRGRRVVEGHIRHHHPVGAGHGIVVAGSGCVGEVEVREGPAAVEIQHGQRPPPAAARRRGTGVAMRHAASPQELVGVVADDVVQRLAAEHEGVGRRSRGFVGMLASELARQLLLLLPPPKFLKGDRGSIETHRRRHMGRIS
ncbi:hypothetical protein VTK73DRAFT_4109 [Phialemonium thermophilum]|uniref:Uncharacterized protein n=1 Tax=Phialemonium thermophilum TaxID=223376 RepID=A0ABR3VBF4_9PEZI